MSQSLFQTNTVWLLDPVGARWQIPAGFRAVCAVCLLEAVSAFWVGGPATMATEARKMARGVTGAGLAGALVYWVLAAAGVTVVPVALAVKKDKSKYSIEKYVWIFKIL